MARKKDYIEEVRDGRKGEKEGRGKGATERRL